MGFRVLLRYALPSSEGLWVPFPSVFARSPPRASSFGLRDSTTARSALRQRCRASTLRTHIRPPAFSTSGPRAARLHTSRAALTSDTPPTDEPPTDAATSPPRIDPPVWRRAAMTGPPLELSVVGVSYDNRQEVIKRTAAGEPLLVVREPTNPVDRNAVAVLTIRGEQLGYVKKELTQHFLEDVTVGRVKAIGHADASLPLSLRMQCVPGHPSLTVDMLPPAFPCTNLSEHMEARAWNHLQRASFAVARYRCQICHEVGARWPVECHERWKVDDATKLITLQGLLALCPACHAVKHMHSGATTCVGSHTIALKHLERVNEWSLQEVQAYVAYVQRTVEERSQTTDWKVDLEWIGSQGPAAVREEAPASQERLDAEK